MWLYRFYRLAHFIKERRIKLRADIASIDNESRIVPLILHLKTNQNNVPDQQDGYWGQCDCRFPCLPTG